jgi:transcriptional regulator with XRE-family HTH domain
MRGRIKQFRETLELSRPQFAKQIHYSESELANVEQKRQRLYAELVAAMVKYADANPDWIFFGEGEMRRTKTEHKIEETNAVYKDVSARQKTLCNFINEAMSTWDPDQQIWLDVQISRCIPEYAEYKEAHKS